MRESTRLAGKGACGPCSPRLSDRSVRYYSTKTRGKLGSLVWQSRRKQPIDTICCRLQPPIRATSTLGRDGKPACVSLSASLVSSPRSAEFLSRG